MKKLLKWTIPVLLLLALAFFFGVPFLARTGSLRWGSEEYARQWRIQLLACQSLDEIKQHFNCFVIEETADGATKRISVSDVVEGRPQALLKSFADGRWIACAHASSHGAPGGGTIVSRDSSGEIHVFLGHVCGHLCARGETLEGFYQDLRGYNKVCEIFLTE
jgi:hypothetical protein